MLKRTYGGAAEAFFAFILTGKVYGSFDYIMGFFGCAQRIYHDDARADKEIPRRFGGAEQRGHQEAVGSGSSAVGGIVDERGVTGERHTDKVHQVVAGKGEGKGESSQEHDYLEHIYFAPMQHLHQYGKEYEETADKHGGVVLYPVLVFRCHERAVLQAFYQHEVDDGSSRDTAEDTDAVLHLPGVVEGKDYTRQPLYQHTEEESDGYRHEYSHDDGQCLVGVDKVSQSESVAAVHFDKREGERTAQQFKDHGHGSGCRHSHGVEYIQQHHVRQHHSQQDTHDFREIEMLRLVDTVAGDVHHTVG